MTRTILLGLLGLALAAAVGFGVHLVTRSTIALPVVQLEPPRAPVATGPTSTDRTTEARISTEDVGTGRETTSGPVSTAGSPVTTTAVETEDNSGEGRGRGRGRSGGEGGGSDDSSGPGGGEDD